MKSLKRAFLAAVASFTIVMFPASVLAGGSSQIMKEMLSPVVQINRNCTATVIKSALNEKLKKVETILLTAKHCVDDSDKQVQEVYIPVYSKNRIIKEDLYRGSVKGMFYKHDLALIQLIDDETIFTNVVKLAPADIELYEGEDVWAVGWPHGQTRSITKGTFGNRVTIPFPTSAKPTEFYRATTQIAGGNSGGALFHYNETENVYEMIGVTSVGMPASDFMSYFVAIDQIQEYVTAATASDKVKIPDVKFVIKVNDK